MPIVEVYFMIFEMIGVALFRTLVGYLPPTLFWRDD